MKDRLFTALTVLLLGACSSPEILEPRSAEVPNGTDLSGVWLIRHDEAGSPRRINEAIRSTAGEIKYSRSRRTPGQPSNNLGKLGQAHIFLEVGELLKITQTDHALYISFDRAVVEEYRFGEIRMVSVGEIAAQRVSGWEGHRYIVETLGKNGMKLTEEFRLIGAGDVLQRAIIFRGKDLEEVTVTQTFDREDG